MKTFVFSVLALVVAVATVDAKCIYCSKNINDHQEIDFEDLSTDRDHQNGDETNDAASKFRIVQTISKRYPLYAEQARQSVRYSDPLNLVDVTESLPNGYIEYKNAMISGVGSAVLKDVNFDRIGNNTFSVLAVLSRADVYGDYAAGTADGSLRLSGPFRIALTDCQFRGRFAYDRFPEIRQETGAESITCGGHASDDDNDPQLERLTAVAGGGAVPEPHRDYVNGAIRVRLADELTVRFGPAIARRLERKFAAAVMFPDDAMQVPRAVADVAPGIRAVIYDTRLEDLANTVTVQKLQANRTAKDSGDADTLQFSFGAFDLTGTAGWTLSYDDGATYSGRTAFTVANVQTAIAARTAADGLRGEVRSASTAVNGLAMTVLAADDGTCESIIELVGQRLPTVLGRSLEAFLGRHFVSVLRNQMAIVGQQDRLH